MINNSYIQEYKRKILHENFNSAKNYKNKFLKKEKLYKFVYLDNIPKCSPIGGINTCPYMKLNKLKIDAIQNQKIWISSYADFNDPFELSTLYIDEGRITEKHHKKEHLDFALDFIKKNMHMSCFTDDFEYNLPMWAHYANNHSGLCLEFEIENPSLIYPVLYMKLDKRLNAATTIHNYVILTYKLIQGNINAEEEKQLFEITNLLVHIFSTKEKPWEYEREYRVFYPNEENKKGGYLVEMKELGLRLTGIYLGNKTDELYKEKIKEISKEIGVDVYQVYPNYSSEKIKLDYKSI